MTMINRGPYPEGALSPGFVTFASDLTVADLGKAVKASGNYNIASGITISLAGDGDQVLGRLEVLESDGAAGVDLAGSHLREYPFADGATPSVGQGIQGGSVAGSVKGVAVGSGGRGLIVSLDESNHKVLVLV